MLEIQNVSKTFNAGTVNQKTALNGLNLKLNEGDFVTVIGGNGAGKSTMLNAVAGVWPVDCGKIVIDGVDVTRLSEHQRAAYIGRVFQDPMTGTAATMQIEENLALAARRGKPRTLRIGITKAEREQYRELLKSLDLGLENRLTARVGETVVGIVRSVEEYGTFIEIAPNLAGLAESCPDLRPGQAVSVYIKNILPEKMKIKLVIVNHALSQSHRFELRYFITEGHLDHWLYSTPESHKRIETDFSVMACNPA